MKVYLDTSVLVASLVGEDASERSLAWFAETRGRALIISDWSMTEFSSALSMKVRSGTVGQEQRAEVLSSWASLRGSSLVTVPVRAGHFLTAANYASNVELRLRAADALHLAIAADHGCSLATLDAAQGRAALELGIAVEDI